MPHRTLTRALPALLAALSLLAGSAGIAYTDSTPADSTAGVGGNVQPASYVYADGLFRAALDVADARWAAQGRPLPCKARLYVYDSYDRSAAKADLGGCRVYLNRAWRDDAWRRINDPHVPLAGRRLALADLCVVATHERGHNLGFGHTATGIMRADGRAHSPACDDWAARLLPKSIRHRSAS